MSGKNSQDPVGSIKRTVGRRGFLAGTAATGGLAFLGVRLAYLQGLDPNGLADEARKNRTRELKVPALRGEILDINGTFWLVAYSGITLRLTKAPLALLAATKKAATKRWKLAPLNWYTSLLTFLR